MGNILSVLSAGALLGGGVIFGNADFIGKFCPSPPPTTDIPSTSPSSSSFYFYFFWGCVGCVVLLAVGVVTAFVKARNRRVPFQRLETLLFAALEEAVEMNRVTITRGNRYGSVDAMEDVSAKDEIVHFERSGNE
ncbi:unnamed protein product [Orchesella dallaii]|uniref:Uncharacterized protein n=1 Tax=Orchesella dallaii TaxID=48710 RepID=A0ABP1RRI9_9HEXA